MKNIKELVSEAKSSVNTCSALKAAQRLEEDNSLTIIDVRESVEYSKAHLDVSTNIPRGVLEWKIAEAYPDSNQAMLVHCATGARAVLATKSLMELGYRNVTAIDASFADISDAFSANESTNSG